MPHIKQKMARSGYKRYVTTPPWLSVCLKICHTKIGPSPKGSLPDRFWQKFAKTGPLDQIWQPQLIRGGGGSSGKVVPSPKMVSHSNGLSDVQQSISYHLLHCMHVSMPAKVLHAYMHQTKPQPCNL